MSWTFCTSGSAMTKAGANAYLVSGAALAQFSNDAEGDICLQTNIDWLTGFSALPTALQYGLGNIASSMIAKQIISYNMTNFMTYEAQTILDMQDDIIKNSMVELKKYTAGVLKTT